MNLKIRQFAFTGLLAGTLLIPAVPAMARDYWHWSNNRWERRADIRSERADLREARRQLQYDLDHHASRRRIAQDQARIRDLEYDLRVDRRYGWREDGRYAWRD
jgi:hypothetical protein